MHVIMDIKNMSKITKPSVNNVILYDGKTWYVTTKQELFKEYDAKLKKFDEVLEEMKKLKKEVASQLMEMSDFIKKLYSKQGEQK